MKLRLLSTARLSLPLATALAVLLGTPATNATTYYWDVNGTAAGFNTVVGAWNGTNAFWNEDATGGAGGPTIIGAPTISDDLNFVAATTNTGTITLTGTQNAQSLTFGSTVGAITLTGGTLNLAAAATITTDSVAGTLHSIASTLSGAGTSLTKAGVGTLYLTHTTNTFNPGEIIISGGILRIGNNTATTLNSGSYAGNISISNGAAFQIYSTSAQTLSGIISGAGNFTKMGTGTLTLGNANTYTGKTLFAPQTNGGGFTVNVSSFNSVNGGTPLLASSSLGAPTTVANGTIDLVAPGQGSVNLTYVAATGETTDRVINLGFNGSAGHTITANNSTGLLRFTSAFTSSTGQTGALTLGGTGAGQIDLGLPQLPTGGLAKAGAGTWTLGGSGSFTGKTLISGGTLSLSSATALQNSPFDTASVAGGAAAGLKIATTTLSLGGLTGANALKGRFTTATGGPGGVTANGGYDGLTNLTLNTAGTTSVYTGAIVDGATGMSLTKTGAGIQTITAANTYTGTTFVNGGFLQLNGSNLTGGLSVSNGHFASNSTFAGLSTVTSGGVISPGASSGAIGTVTFSNATASALTLDGGTGIFDLPSTVTTPDQIAVTGGLVVTNTNTVLLRTPLAGTPAGVYNLITSSALSGAGSLVLANGSATRGNATVSTSGNDVILTVAAGGLAGTTTYTGTSGNFNVEKWFVTTNWNSGVVPTGTTNVVLPDQTGAINIPAFNTGTTAFSGDLWIGNNVTLQVGSTSGNAAFNNVLGTPGSTIIYMGQNSAINSRNSGFNPTLPQIILLGDASMRFQESTQVKVDPNFANSISGAFTLTLNSGNGNGFSTATLNAANSFAGLNLAGTAGVVNAAVSGSIGTATLTISGGGTVNLNHATALSDGTNAIRINNGTLAYGTSAAAPLTLNTRPIELNGTGQATIANNATSSANILTLNNSISSTAAGAKTLFFSGTNTGLNLASGDITNGSGGGSIAVTKNAAGTWELSGDNSYTGLTTVANNGTLILSGDNIAMTGGVTLSTSTGVAPKLHINTATALGTGTLNFGGGAASDTVQIDNSSAGLVTVSTANAITLNRNFTFAGTQSLNLGAGTATIGGLTTGTNRNINVTLNTLTFGGAVAEAVANVGINKQGAGTLVFKGTGSSYTGATAVSAGTLAGIGTNAFGNTSGISIAAASTATLSLRGDTDTEFKRASDSVRYALTTTANGATINVDQATIGDTGSQTMTIGTLALNNAVTNGTNFTGANNTSLSIGAVTTSAAASGTETLTNNIASTGALTLASIAVARTGAPTLAFAGDGNTTVTGNITQAATTALTKSGNGTLTLLGTSSHSGATTVNAGKLLVNGSIATSSMTTVKTGATLGGSGTTGNVTVESGGTVAPGNSPGILTMGGLTTSGNASFSLELNGLTAGTDYDQMKINSSFGSGTVSLGGISVLNVTLSSTPAPNQKFVILLNDGTDPVSGLFYDGATPLGEGDIFTAGGNSLQISYVANEDGSGGAPGNDVVLTAIPEASTSILGLASLWTLLLRRSR